MVVVAPVAIMAGKKAADNPAASLFLAVRVGAVLVQGLKKLPGFGIDLLGNIPGVAPVKAAYVAGREAVVDVWETEGDLLEGFETITQDQDPLGKQFFGDFSGYNLWGIGRQARNIDRDSVPNPMQFDLIEKGLMNYLRHLGHAASEAGDVMLVIQGVSTESPEQHHRFACLFSGTIGTPRSAM